MDDSPVAWKWQLWVFWGQIFILDFVPIRIIITGTAFFSEITQFSRIKI